MLNIYLSRHGQDEDNAKGILNGRRNKPLSALGLEQAKQLAQFIKEKEILFNCVYSSPLIRAYQTAEIVTETLKLAKPIILPELVERDFGVMSGQLIADIKKLCAPDILETETVTYFLKVEEAETFPDLVMRAKKLLALIEEKHADGNILLVGHGDFGKMVYAAYYDIPWQDALRNFHFGNTELVLLTENISDFGLIYNPKQFNK